MALSFSIAWSRFSSGMRRSKVNIKVARIFNGVFETRKSTQKGKKNAESGAFET
jgi:hypothetical protein